MLLARDDKTLPIELFGEIFKHLTCSSLLSCTLLCRSLYSIAQRYLFYRVTVMLAPVMTSSLVIRQQRYPYECRGMPSLFLKLLRTSPQIAQYVGILNVYVSDGTVIRAEEIIECTLIIGSVPNLKTLTFPVVTGTAHFRKKWYPIRNVHLVMPILYSALMHDTLAELDVSNISRLPHLPLRATDPQPHLRRLTLSSIDDSRFTEFTTNGRRLHVTELALLDLQDSEHTLSNNFDLISLWLRSPRCCIALESVKHLDIRILKPGPPTRAEDGVDELLSLFPNLQSLYFLPNSQVSRRFQANTLGSTVSETYEVAQEDLQLVPASLVRMGRLREVTLHIKLFRISIFHDPTNFKFWCGLPFAAALLQRVAESSVNAGPNIISVLRLVLGMKFTQLSYTTLVQEIPTWVDIVDVLSSRNFPMLRVVELEVSIDRHTSERSRSIIREQLKCMKAFQRLRNNGISVFVI